MTAQREDVAGAVAREPGPTAGGGRRIGALDVARGLAEELVRNYPAAVGENRAAYLAAFAADARQPGDGDRELAENVLGRELRELPDDLPGVPAALRTDLTGTTTRVALARRFYNDAVRDTHALRRSRLSRVLRLHAGRPLPRYFDIDDGLDAVLAGSPHSGGPRPRG